MFARAGLLTVFVLCLGATECRLDEDDLGPEEDVAFETLEYDDGDPVRGSVSGNVHRHAVGIRDINTFTDFWNAHSSGFAPEPGTPEVDFGTDMVIAVGLGEQETGGYAILIEDVRENDEFIIVEVEIETPGDGCEVDDGETQPHHMVVVPDSDKPVTFSDAVVDSTC